MNANYAEICMVGNLEADFQQVQLDQFFLKFSKYCCLFVCVEVLWPSQPNEVMSDEVILPNHTFTGQA